MSAMDSAASTAKDLGRALLGSFARVKQSAEEKLGKADKTAFEPQMDALMLRADRIKLETEALLRDLAAYLQPNPTRRLENAVYKKLNRKAKERLSDVEVLGGTMIQASVALGVSMPYGRALEETGSAQLRLGELWAAHQEAVDDCLVRPSTALLAADLRQATLERKALERSRLDLDAARARSRRAPPEKAAAAAAEVQQAHAQYDACYSATRAALDAVVANNDEGVRRLLAFATAQQMYHSAAAAVAKDLAAKLTEIAATVPAPVAGAAGSSAAGAADAGIPVRVLCDYDAIDANELSLVADEIVYVRRDPALPSGWVLGTVNGRTGRVSTAYLDVDASF